VSDKPAIRSVRLSKWYGRVTALNDVSLHLEPGVWGLLGPNGSGKTTFMRICAGQLRPSLGETSHVLCGEGMPPRRRKRPGAWRRESSPVAEAS